MKLIKILLMVLFGLAAIWIGLMVLGIVSTVVHLLFWLAILYIVGMIVWKLIGSSSQTEQSRPEIEAKRQMESLKEATVKLEEMKRKHRIKQ
jgi:membrane protein implicated in regulation of membrane protease activity